MKSSSQGSIVAEAALVAFGCRLRLIACCLFHNKDRARSQLSAAGVKTNFAATTAVAVSLQQSAPPLAAIRPQSLPDAQRGQVLLVTRPDSLLDFLSGQNAQEGLFHLMAMLLVSGID
jgi:hypothetical protein